VFSSQFVSKLSSIFGTFFGLRHTTLKSPQRLFGFTKMTRIGYCLPVGIGVEVIQSHINTDLIGSWFTFFQPFLVKTKLSVVSVCTTDNPDTLNLLQLIEMPIAGSPHFKISRFKIVRESDISPLFGKPPSTGFVLNRTMCLLFCEPRIPLFPWFVLIAVVIKARNGRPCSNTVQLRLCSA